jgi:hypothetical protein
MKKNIGIDIGNVIIGGDTDEKSNFFGKDYLNVSMIPDALVSIKFLIEREGAENIFLVSKCGKATQARTLLYLEYHNFFERTKLDQKNLYFCLERHEKKEICERLNIKIFIDDRFTVLSHIAELKDRKLFLFSPNKTEYELYKNSEIRNEIILIQNWKDLLKII